MPPRNVHEVLSRFDEPWSPRTVATVNDYDVRVFKARGEFTPHRHDNTDELFYVIEGRLTIRMESGDVELGPGDLFVVPRGVQHQPFSEHGASALLLEPSATVNTGDNPGDLTAPRVALDD